jgi:20S proteasome alpha/beta subunit
MESAHKGATQVQLKGGANRVFPPKPRFLVNRVRVSRPSDTDNFSSSMDSFDEVPASKGVDSGTTIMAVAFDGGVVMGADSRTSTGSYVANRVSDKITALHDRIFVCRSGSAAGRGLMQHPVYFSASTTQFPNADTQALTDYVRRFVSEHSIEKGRLPTVRAASKLFRSLAYENKDRLMAGTVVGISAAALHCS